MQWIKQFIPKSVLKAVRPLYHGCIAWLGSIWFGSPSEKLIVIGVTGTNGKSTTVNLIAHILEASGKRTGFTSTVNYKISGEESLNTFKMTMPSGWVLHKWLAHMVRAGCQYAVLEISSEGLAQNRHKGIHFDAAVFTNLTPEHLDSHGGFENYKKSKAILFQALTRYASTPEKLNIYPGLTKSIVVNSDDENGSYYSSFPADTHLAFGIRQPADFRAEGFKASLRGLEFDVQGVHFHTGLKGLFDVYNCLAAIAAVSVLDISLETCRRVLETVSGVPGRMEIIQEHPFMVLVDYAPEPYALQALYETILGWPKHRLIHILGSTGGGRDRQRRHVLGKMAGETADIVIVTNEDPYDDDPQEIIDEVAAGAIGAGKKLDQTLFKVSDRRAAIIKAFRLAVEGDLVLITGKGSEQKMAVAHGAYVDWDDRKVARQELGFQHMQEQKYKTVHNG